MGLIMPIGFGDKQYFFTFIDNYTPITKTYTAKQKSEWFKCLKAFHNLGQIRIKLDRLTECLQSNYDSKLQNQKVDKWFTNQGIVFKLLAVYFQEENGMSKKTDQTIMEMVRATILKKEIEDTFWPKVLLAITYVKNPQPIRALEDSINPIEKQDDILSSLQHLRVLGSTVYVFFYEEERIL